MNLLAGTSGFAFKEWKGPFYPADLKDDGMLGFYAGRFPTVEINNTFYRLPKRARAAGLGGAGAGPVHVRDQGEPAHHALRAAQARGVERRRVPAQEHLGARRAARADPLSAAAESEERRRRGCARSSRTLPTDRRYTIEFRHESWFDDDVYARAARARHRDVHHRAAGLRVAGRDDGVVGLRAPAPLRLRRRGARRVGKRIASQPWSEAYVFFKHDEGIGSGPPAVDAFIESFDKAPTA